MNTLINNMYFFKLRDQGKFSKKFEGKHSYFLYLEPIEEDKKKLEIYINDDYDDDTPPAPRYRYPNKDSKFMNRYFNKLNMPDRTGINRNI
jgi:hypothetical protein